MSLDTFLIAAVLLAGLYMAWNIGANDVANAIGTSVGSGALTLRQACIMAAILEFCGAFFFGSHVSETVQTGIVHTDNFAQTPYLLVYGMLSALIASGVWLQIASYYGWPVSTTHSIIGAIVGFGMVSGGYEIVQWDNVAYIVSSWIISPILGALLSYTIFSFLRRKVFYHRHPMEAAKRLTPYLVLFAVTMLGMLVVYDQIEELKWRSTFWPSLAISLGAGGVAALISHWLIKDLKIRPSHTKRVLPYGPEVALELDKAKKHLTTVQDTSTGELHYYVSLIIEEVDNMSHSLKKEAEEEPDNSEYTAVERIFSYLQMMSAAFMAFAHGANDVANAIGPVAAALAILTNGYLTTGAEIPAWLLGLGGLGIVVGLATWGWRVIETIGKKITELTPTRGFCAELAAATTVVFASRLGMPISTTHTLVGAVIGIAFARGIGALNLGTTRDIILSWIVTVPAGALIAAAAYSLMTAF
ncbi:MAG: inorganic phosphate transporter [Chlamydiales bacterium]|nr:inorganic phosphate transporter [Chlamydiales bacterium]